MIGKPARGLFIVGVCTDVGKTYVASLIARQLVSSGRRVGVYKPAASGCRREAGRLVSDDAESLWHAAGRPGSLADVCPQCFEAPLAPFLAAEAEGKAIDESLLADGLSVWGDRCEIVLVEGAGGLLSPVGPNVDVADLARQFGYPLVVVAPNRLGAINQTLQTLLAARSIPDGPPVAGVVLNHVAPTDDPSAATNRRELERRGSAPILGEVFWQADRMDLEVDWISLADAKKADF